jgi:hypothetical protein
MRDLGHTNVCFGDRGTPVAVKFFFSTQAGGSDCGGISGGVVLTSAGARTSSGSSTIYPEPPTGPVSPGVMPLAGAMWTPENIPSPQPFNSIGGESGDRDSGPRPRVSAGYVSRGTTTQLVKEIQCVCPT